MHAMESGECLVRCLVIVVVADIEGVVLYKPLVAWLRSSTCKEMQGQLGNILTLTLTLTLTGDSSSSILYPEIDRVDAYRSIRD